MLLRNFETDLREHYLSLSRTMNKNLTTLMRIATLLLTIIIYVSGVSATTTDDTPYLRLMGLADSAIAKEDWRKAEMLLVEALRLEPANPSNVILVSNLGMMRFYQGRDSMAIATLNDAHEMAPRAVVVLSNRGSVLAALGQYDKAYADWEAILEIDSLHTGARYLHAMEAMRRGDVATAARDVDFMDRNADSDPRTDLARGTFYSAIGRYADAIPSLNHSIEAAPTSELYSTRALCYLMTGALNEASADIAQGMALDPADGELYLYRALLNRLRYRNDDAKADARRAVELGISPDRAAPLMK